MRASSENVQVASHSAVESDYGQGGKGASEYKPQFFSDTKGYCDRNVQGGEGPWRDERRTIPSRSLVVIVHEMTLPQTD